jgi:hypothetical protein
MKKWMIILFGPSLFGLVSLTAQTPVIISQPTSISACDGDSVSIVVIAEGNCSLQWFTAQKNGSAFTNYNEIAGEISYRLTLNPVHVSNPYYLLRLAGETDTIWSEGIKVSVQIPQKPIEDTLFVNHVPGYARLFDGFMVTNLQLIWSTGDTSFFPSRKPFVQFINFGNHWVKTIQNGCSRTDTFVVAECPHTLHIDSIAKVPECWCADTIYIERDVIGGVTSVASGTTIKFTGDYWIDSGSMDARAVGGDSIVIEGYFDPITQKQQGEFTSINISPHGEYIPTTFENTIFKHMDRIQLFRTGSATFYRNNYVRNYDAQGVFHQNKRVEISHAASASIFLENDSVFGEAAPTPRGAIPYFYFLGNTFENNKSGLIIKGGSNPHEGGWVNISRNIFRNNPATVISSHAIYNYLDNNLFIKNYPGENSLMQFSNYLAFRNNTLINNEGTGVLLYENPYSSYVGGDIMNNIFYNAPERISINVTAVESSLKIDHNSFSGDSTSIIAPADTSINIFSNLFSTNPEFKDTLRGDYALMENSPIIDKGADIEHGPVGTDFYYEKDFTGFPRKTGLAVDPGAYEYHPVLPLAFDYITPDTVVCNRDTITLKALPEGGFDEDHFTFAWYMNGTRYREITTPYLTINQVTTFDTANYEAVMTNGIDTLRSGRIHLSVIQKPDLSTQSGYQLACNGADLSVKISRPQVHTGYYWTSALHGPYNQPTTTLNLTHVVESDTLFLTAVNQCGSAQSGPIILKIAPLPAPSLGADTTLHAGDSLLLDAGEGVRYAWSTSESSAQVYGTPNDTLWVMVTNAYGCSASDTVVISMIPSRLDEPQAHTIQLLLYPNPARDHLFVSIPDDADLPCNLQLIAANGTVVRDIVLSSVGVHDTQLTSLEKGTYTVILLSETKRGTGKLVVW